MPRRLPTLARVAAVGALLVPAALAAWGAAHDALGANPVESLTHTTGDWALRSLMLSLAVTPARRHLGLPWLAPWRRSFGLVAYAYAVAHFSIFLVLDLGLDPGRLLEEVSKRPYVTAGFASLVLLTPLAITSTRGWQRRLGRRWVGLHRLVYPAAMLAVVHFLWLVKADLLEPSLYAAALAVVLLARIAPARRPALNAPAHPRP